MRRILFGLLLGGVTLFGPACGTDEEPIPLGEDVETGVDAGPGDTGPGDGAIDVGLDGGDADTGYCNGPDADYHCHPGLIPDTYAPGITKRTNKATFDVALTSEPEPAVSPLELSLTITRTTTGALADDVQLRVIPDLHDAEPSERRPVVEALGGGQYRVTGVEFDQAGLWELAVLVFDPANGNSLEVVSFFFVAL